MSTHSTEDWNPVDPGVLHEQTRSYDQMRERCPVAHSTFMEWSLFSHADVAAVLSDTITFSNASPFPAIPNGMDPPEHGDYRQALECHFNAEALERYKPTLQIIAAEQLSPLLAAGSAEFMSAFVVPFMMKSQCAMLGWPQEHWQQLSDWTKGNTAAALHQDQEAGKALAIEFAELVKGQLERQRNDVASHANATTVLLQTSVNGMALTDDQIITVLRNWVAGQGTTATGLGLLAEHLATDSALQNQLRNEPALIPGAIEEILRHEGPLVANRRTVTRDISIAGKDIHAGEKLALMWIAANRDPALFYLPDTVDIGRDTTQSLVWGQGIHLCQGAPLARLELAVALEELLARTSQFDRSGAFPARTVYPANGPAELRLRFS